ncbi:DUF4440 domain-containing protein [Paraflavitalea soli]|uniref:DUF4440 domain-containing protein n=1 Tax=Paraflavitalea soli TaxID=2315862 RepID=A0A3B7ML07_9BACT|nr:DUF4440 domain-containing protein [Paraflavitalea soli]AXY74868.1 DUF4440 domain-containing protein [Paraflavitalea soli]
MKSIVCIRIVLAGLLSLSGIYSVQAQSTPEELSKVILQKDSLFWKGYNDCDTSLTGQFLAAEIEFFHDKGGITKGRQAMQESLKKNLCSDNNYRLRREAIPGTVKVYPLAKNNEIYGAIMVGEHYFYVTKNGKPEFRDGHASFNHLWLKKDGEWKMERILSYDHHEAAPDAKTPIKLPAAVLRQYAGLYKGPQTDSLLIRDEKGVLVMISRNKKTTIYPESANTFFMKERPIVFEFIRDTKKKVTSLRVMEHGALAEELTLVK